MQGGGQDWALLWRREHPVTRKVGCEQFAMFVLPLMILTVVPHMYQLGNTAVAFSGEREWSE